MRDLRFRIWDPNDGEYTTFDLAAPDALVDWDASQEETDEGNGSVDVRWRKGLVIEQYTGLKDSKGVDICEGDIIQDHYNDGTKGPVGLVKWISRADGWDICGFHTWPARLPLGDWREDNPTVVIGNLHQNPELLTP